MAAGIIPTPDAEEYLGKVRPKLNLFLGEVLQITSAKSFTCCHCRRFPQLQVHRHFQALIAVHHNPPGALAKQPG